MMYDWDRFDEEAARESAAIKNAFKAKRPRKPSGVSRNSILNDNKDLLAELKVCPPREGDYVR